LHTPDDLRLFWDKTGGRKLNGDGEKGGLQHGGGLKKPGTAIRRGEEKDPVFPIAKENKRTQRKPSLLKKAGWLTKRPTGATERSKKRGEVSHDIGTEG